MSHTQNLVPFSVTVVPRKMGVVRCVCKYLKIKFISILLIISVLSKGPPSVEPVLLYQALMEHHFQIQSRSENHQSNLLLSYIHV